MSGTEVVSIFTHRLRRRQLRCAHPKPGRKSTGVPEAGLSASLEVPSPVGIRVAEQFVDQKEKWLRNQELFFTVQTA